MEQAMRRLTRSRRDRVFAGICGGLAEYLGLDPVLVRVLYVVLTLLSNLAAILLYVLAWMIIPLEAENEPRAVVSPSESSQRGNRRIAGVLLVIVGLLALLTTQLGWFNVFHNLRLAGPIILVLIGVALIMWRRQGADKPEASDSTHLYGAEEGTAPLQRSTGTSARRVWRLERGRKIAGVCAGLGEYFDLDPTIVRLLFFAAVFAGGAGVLLYIIMWIAVPLKRELPESRAGA